MMKSNPVQIQMLNIETLSLSSFIKIKRLINVLYVILLFSFIFVNVYAEPVDITVIRMMPTPGFSKDWQLDGKIKTFDPATSINISTAKQSFIYLIDSFYKDVMLRKSEQYLLGAANLGDLSKGMLIIERMLLRIPSKK